MTPAWDSAQHVLRTARQQEGRLGSWTWEDCGSTGAVTRHKDDKREGQAARERAGLPREGVKDEEALRCPQMMREILTSSDGKMGVLEAQGWHPLTY